MRTTLAIDDDVLAAARAMAERQRRSLGEIISSLARAALHPENPPARLRNGVPLLPTKPGASAVTLDLVNRLRDELP
jgi:hypothetical protein